MKAEECRIIDSVEMCGGKVASRGLPSVLEENYNGSKEISLPTWCMRKRIIFLTEKITDETANDFFLQLTYLAESNDPVDIILNSPGGSVQAGMTIIDLIKSLEGKIPIRMWVNGMAASMAAVILAAVPKGNRFISPSSMVMIHAARVMGEFGIATAADLRKTADSITETEKKTNAILAAGTGKTVRQIQKDTSFDNFMTAEEAVTYGIADEVKVLFS